MKLLVVIVTFNGMKWVDRCLRSVAGSSVPADIFVCDNLSTDGTADYIAANYPAVHLVRSKTNLGFARANDLGLKYALQNSYDYVYLLNQDACVMPDTFKILINEIQKGGWGILSPMQMKADLSGVDEQFRKHSLKAGAEKPYEVKFVMAAHWMLSLECIETVGLFSPAFTHYGEDNNYCDRARYHHMKVGVCPAAEAVHDRASRPRPKSYRMGLKKGFARVCLSNPNIPFWFEAVWQPVSLCLMSIRWLSAIPAASIPSLIKEYGYLLEVREESCDKGAFAGLA